MIRNKIFPENHCITFNKHSLILYVLMREAFQAFAVCLGVFHACFWFASLLYLPISQSYNICHSFQSPIDRDTSHATNISIEEHSVQIGNSALFESMKMESPKVKAPTSNATEETLNSIIHVNSPRKLTWLLESIDGLPTKPPSLFLDAEGVSR